jgi:iron(III) transport system ATP-binding protein
MDAAGVMPPALATGGLRVAYGSQVVLDAIDLEVLPGETVSLLGPSGSGKTTLLYAIAGFVEPDAGLIRLNGHAVAGEGRSVPPEERDVAVVFQNYALWPHLTARQTVAYPLRRRRIPSAEADVRAAELLELMGVGKLADRHPTVLSGGEQQRVGVARALAREASLVLLDEPTAHLDTPLRARLLAELSEQRRRSGAAALYATHDVGEALAVADRVGVLRNGRLVQLAAPRRIYEEPVDAWVAGLTGPASVLAASLVSSHGGLAQLQLGEDRVSISMAASPAPMEGTTLDLLVRPDWASLGGELAGVVVAAFYRGPHTDYRLATVAGEVELREPGPPRLAPGDKTGWSLRRGWALPLREA